MSKKLISTWKGFTITRFEIEIKINWKWPITTLQLRYYVAGALGGVANEPKHTVGPVPPNNSSIILNS